MHRLPSLGISIVVLVWMFVAVSPSAAQYFGRNKVQYDDFDFRSFRTENFEFYYYPEERQAVEDAARMAERWYRRHSRTFLREFTERKPVIFYANDADFHQTNVISGFIGEGTGGVTEALKERVVMPLTGIYSETDHVLGHELVHSFQYDIGLSREDSTRFSLHLLPLWLIEGMAEYFSVGREDPHTAMWIRDAILRDDLPTIEDLSRGTRYFPYRYGQAYLAYIGGKYGDLAVANLFKLGGRTGLDSAFVYTLGITADSLSTEWKQAVKNAYLPLMEGRRAPADVGRRILAEEQGSGRINIAPAVSPDGKWVAFLSEKDLFNINLFIADAETGQIVKKLKATNSNPHFDAIRFINSAGSWSPDGRKFAFVIFAEGDNEIAIWDLDSGSIERRVAVEGVTALSNPAWSPDGKSIAFSGLDGGISDLYILDVETRVVRQLTNDRYADLQPAWSPDGNTIAVVTDRGPDGTDFRTLAFAHPRLALIDVQDGAIEIVQPFPEAKHINPQFSPDGRNLYFISDQDGFSDIYRYALDTKDVYRITRVKTGISGITKLSPAMSVGTQSGRMMFSVFSDNEYTVHALEADELTGTPVETGDTAEAVTRADSTRLAGVLPPFSALDQGVVSNYLDDPLTGLPTELDVEAKDYRAKLHLDYVAPPTIGASVGGPYGAGLAGGVGFYFSDMLGNRQLGIVAQANGTFKDIGGQVVYINRGNRFNYGGAIAHIPFLFGGTAYGQSPNGSLVVQEIQQRIYIDQAVAIGAYPFSTTRRVEGNLGMLRYGYDYDVIQYTLTSGGWIRERIDLDAPDPVYFLFSSGAYVGDFSNFGFTSPLQGGRYRLELSPQIGITNRNQIGSDAYVTALVDYRRYFFMKPVTFAVRGLHIGNYGVKGSVGGSSTEQAMFGREFLGYPYYPGFVRGYNFNSFDFAVECGPNEITDEGTCATLDRLMGTRIAMASAELRLPFFGTEALGLINFPYLPTELTLFTDAGLAWNAGDNPLELLKFEQETAERVPVVSVGSSARFNVLGYLILEIYYAYPFQRPGKGAHFGFQLLPGW